MKQQGTKMLGTIAAFLAFTATPWLLLLNNVQSMDTRGQLRSYDEDEARHGGGRRDLSLVSRKNELLFVHIPKTGGTSIEKSKLMEDVVHPEGHLQIDPMMREAKGMEIDVTIRASILRHPCSRFISAFRYLTSKICNSGDHEWAVRHIGNRTLDEFVALMDREPIYAEEILTEVHFRPQHFWVFSEDSGEFGLDLVLCNEQWDESMERLYEKLPGDVDRSDLPFTGGKTEASLKNPHESCANLNDSTRRAIERFYELDYCIFGYDSLPHQEVGGCVGSVCGEEGQSSCPVYFTNRAQFCKEKREASARSENV